MRIRLSLPYLLLFLLLPGTWTLYAQQPLTAERAVRERDPVLTFSGETLYFTRVNHPRNQGPGNAADIWARTQDAEGDWERAINPGSPINSFGKDRMLHVSVDGNRLSVLREGAENVIDVLERSGRNWRVTGSWPVPEDVRSMADLTFNVNGYQLIYATRKPGADDSDLYTRTASTRGAWTEPTALDVLNTAAEERAPLVASDGRTLFFRRNGKWQRQADNHLPAQPVDLATRYRQLTAAPGLLVTATDDLGEDERLFEMPASHVSIPGGKLSYAGSATPPAPGEYDVIIPVTGGVRLTVRPDVLRRYPLVLREGETSFPDQQIPPVRTDRPAGSLAGTPVADPSERERYLTQRLKSRQQELNRLDAVRRQSYTGIVSDDPERAALRSQLQQINEANGDTLPPVTGGSTRARYARDLAELERMKAKFRRQQSERLGDPVVDTLNVEATVRDGLYAEQRRSPQDDPRWERRVRSDLPRTTALTAEEAARLDEAYARQMREVEALRAQLRELQGQSVDQDLQAKSPASPVLTGEPAGLGPADLITETDDAAVQQLELAFIPNTAYPNSAGYDALDQLVEVVKAAGTVVEIRVHTSRTLSPRAAQLLSEERAVTIRDHLRQAGIAPENFRVIGYGNHESAAGERVEFIAR
jgi:outer membrane protein OmpA-like peptidoglycan-associated protein